MRRLFGYTWVGWLNILVLQWFFVRLARVINTETGNSEGFTLLKGIFPLTGWGWSYWKEYKNL